MSNEIVPYGEIERMGAAIAKSGLFGIKTPEQAIALMLVAQAEGLHPAAAARDYHIVQGRPSLKADAMLARFQAAGGRVRWTEMSETRVAAVFSHPSGGDLELAWTLEDAKRAGLAGRDTWRQYPRQMLRARVISEGIRSVYPGVVAGTYTPEEMQDADARPAPEQTAMKPLGNGSSPVVPEVLPPSPDPMEGGTEILAPLADGVPGIPADAPKPVFDATRDPLPLMRAMMAIHDLTRDPDHEAAVKLEALRHEWETSRSKSNRPWDEERVRVYWYEVAFYLAGRAGDYPLLQRYGLALTETWKDEKARPSSLYDAYKAAKKRCLTKKGSTQ